MIRHSPSLPLHIGCPVWGCPDWGGVVYPEGTGRSHYLAWYSWMFNTVECNSTFYSIPSVETVRRWAHHSAAGFQFCVKAPRAITHEARLEGAGEVTAEFLRVIGPLASLDRLGLIFLQLPPSFGPDCLFTLERYLRRLPLDLPWALELRHPAWFDQDKHEQRINALLAELGIDKVLLDSRPLFQGPPDDATEATAQHRKPQVPVRQTVTATRPMLRLIGRNRLDRIDRFLDQWAPIVARWIEHGLDPFVLTHTPDETFAPHMARRWVMRLQQELPDRDIELPPAPHAPRQQSFLGESE